MRVIFDECLIPAAEVKQAVYFRFFRKPLMVVSGRIINGHAASSWMLRRFDVHDDSLLDGFYDLFCFFLGSDLLTDQA